MDKNALYDTGFSYCPPSTKEQNRMTTSRTISNMDKENVLPCAAQLQTFVTNLTQKKSQLKNLIVERQKLNDIATEQSAKIDSESIKQSF